LPSWNIGVTTAATGVCDQVEIDVRHEWRACRDSRPQQVRLTAQADMSPQKRRPIGGGNIKRGVGKAAERLGRRLREFGKIAPQQRS
jgi:hypothetical protein